MLESFADRYHEYWGTGMRAKLGLDGTDGADHHDDDPDLIDDLLVLLHAQNVDFTSFFRTLSAAVRGDAAPVRSHFDDPAAFDAWTVRWQESCRARSRAPKTPRTRWTASTPCTSPETTRWKRPWPPAPTTTSDRSEQLLDVLAHPFDERPGLESYATPAPPSFGRYRTFCGT